MRQDSMRRGRRSHGRSALSHIRDRACLHLAPVGVHGHEARRRDVCAESRYDFFPLNTHRQCQSFAGCAATRPHSRTHAGVVDGNGANDPLELSVELVGVHSHCLSQPWRENLCDLHTTQTKGSHQRRSTDSSSESDAPRIQCFHASPRPAQRRSPLGTAWWSWVGRSAPRAPHLFSASRRQRR
jgi:hypothetical protein